MAHRTFLDSRGMEWQAWDVQPQGIERRHQERRSTLERIGFADRRHGDRRVTAGRWSPLTTTFRDGWLCFDAGLERRRLVPIPNDWEYCADERLEGYCAAASPVRRSGPGARQG